MDDRTRMDRIVTAIGGPSLARSTCGYKPNGHPSQATEHRSSIPEFKQGVAMAKNKQGVDRREFLGGMAVAAGTAGLLSAAATHDVSAAAAAPAGPAPMKD